VLNLGFGGSTIEALRLLLCPLSATRLNPRSLLLYAGDNDPRRRTQCGQVLGWFRSLADKVAANLGAVPFGFVSVKPSPARYPIIGRIRRFNDQVRQEIESRPRATTWTSSRQCSNPSGKPRAEFFLEDGLHLSRQGYRLWSRLLEPHRNQIFTN